MAVAGMVLGIIGVVFAFIPIFGAFVAIPCVGVGMPLAAVAFYQARKKVNRSASRLPAWRPQSSRSSSR